MSSCSQGVCYSGLRPAPLFFAEMWFLQSGFIRLSTAVKTEPCVQPGMRLRTSKSEAIVLCRKTLLPSGFEWLTSPSEELQVSCSLMRVRRSVRWTSGVVPALVNSNSYAVKFFILPVSLGSPSDHEKWIMTQRKRSRIQVVEMSITTFPSWTGRKSQYRFRTCWSNCISHLHREHLCKPHGQQENVAREEDV